MPNRAQVEMALRNADKAGDVKAATALAKHLKSMSAEGSANKGIPVNSPDIALGEAATTMATGLGSTVAGGLYGAASLPFVGIDKAVENIRMVQEAGTYVPRTQGGRGLVENIGKAGEFINRPVEWLGDSLGDAAYNATGSPAAGAAGKTLPDAALLALTGGAGRGARTIKPVVPPKPIKAYEKIAEDVRKGKPTTVAEDVRPNPEILDAAKAEKIDLNPSHYSENPTYIELEQSLKSRPGSLLVEREASAIRQIGERAESLIDDLGGSVDRSVFDAKVRLDVDSNITRLETAAEGLYKKVNSRIPNATIVTADSAKAYIEKTLSELGGNHARLRPPEKALLDLLDEKQPLTYFALDRLRKDVGQGFRGKGVYKDEDISTLSEVYGALSNDQLSVARNFGIGDTYTAAQKLVATRKGLEDQSKALFGKNIDKSIAPTVRAVSVALVKGDIPKYNKFIESVPAHLRHDASVAVLNDLFTYGSRAGDSVGGGFATAFHSLNRNKGALEAILKDLPETARQRFTNLGKISEGLYKAKSRENTSRTARDVISAMEDPKTFAKFYSATGKVVAAEGVSTSLGIPGAGAAAALTAILMKGKTSFTEAADAFLASPALRKAIEVAADGRAALANKIVQGTPKYKAWVETLPAKQQRQIAKVGFVAWLTESEQ